MQTSMSHDIFEKVILYNSYITTHEMIVYYAILYYDSDALRKNMRTIFLTFSLNNYILIFNNILYHFDPKFTYV